MEAPYSFLKIYRQSFFVFLITLCLFFSVTNFVYAVDILGSTGNQFAANATAIAGGAAGLVNAGIDLAIFRPMAWLIYKFATGIGGIISGLGALLLDISIQYTVIEMGTILGPNSELGKNVQALWRVVRDIINILFIFGFIYIGIKTILDSQKSETRRTLGYLIIAALMINFSLYITEVVIDFSNIAATQVYQLVVSGGLASGAVVNSNDPMAVGTPSLAGAFWDIAGISSFFGGEGLPPGLDSGMIIVYSVFMMIFLIAAGTVFFMGATLLIKRFIALTLYMIFSPIMFIGWIFPAFSSKQEGWREGFINQAFVAPIFLFMLYLSLVLLQKLRLASGFSGTDFTGIVKGSQMEAGHISVVLFFCMMIGFLYASIQVSDKMSKAGASSMLGFLDTGRSWAHKKFGDATLGAMAGIGRNTIGKRAAGVAENKDLLERASGTGVNALKARMKLATARSVADSNFDGRGVGGFGKTFGIGEGRKGGYKTRQEEIDKKEKEYAKALGEVDDDDATVNQFIQEKESLERQLKKAKHYKEKTKDGTQERADAQDKINEFEKAIKEKEEIIKQEKARRQVGSYVDAATEPSTKPQYDSAKSKIKDAKNVFDGFETDGKTPKTYTEEDRRRAAMTINGQNKIIKGLQEKAKKNTGNTGYAGVLEQSGFIGSAIFGRTRGQDRAAGKAVRKQFAKGHLKEEAHKHDDKGHAPAAAAKPAAGGGHDNHGGGGHH